MGRCTSSRPTQLLWHRQFRSTRLPCIPYILTFSSQSSQLISSLLFQNVLVLHYVNAVTQPALSSHLYVRFLLRGVSFCLRTVLSRRNQDHVAVSLTEASRLLAHMVASIPKPVHLSIYTPTRGDFDSWSLYQPAITSLFTRLPDLAP